METTLRPFKKTDLASLVKHADNPKVFANMRDIFPSPYTVEEGEKFLARMLPLEIPYVLAIDLDGEVIGGIGIHQQADIYRLNAEMGYWLGEAFWGKGIMSRTIPKMVDYGFKNFEISRIYAIPFGRNHGSIKALENAGFKLEARMNKTIFKNGKLEDELIYAVRRGEMKL